LVKSSNDEQTFVAEPEFTLKRNKIISSPQEISISRETGSLSFFDKNSALLLQISFDKFASPFSHEKYISLTPFLTLSSIVISGSTFVSLQPSSSEII
jgi:hypothetical protein